MASSTAAPIIPNAIIPSTDRIARAHQTPFCARGLLKTIAVSEKGAGAHGNVPRAGGCSTDGTPESAHTWQQRASAMGKRRSCDGRPHRAVQNQAFCCTGRPRRTVRCRKWPCGVREARLSIGGCARQWQQEQVRRPDTRAVADNTLTIKQKSTLPVRIQRQVKPLIYSVSRCYPPPPGTIAPTKPRRRSNRASDETAETLTPHRSAATSPSWASIAAAPILSATSFRLRPPPVLHDDLRCCHRRAACAGPKSRKA